MAAVRSDLSTFLLARHKTKGELKTGAGPGRTEQYAAFRKVRLCVCNNNY